MSRLIPFPVASGGLFALWLLLNQTFSIGHILLGGVIAVVGGWTLAALELPKTRLQRIGVMARLAAVVLIDIVRSNIAVAGLILDLKRSRRTAGFVEIPLELRNPYGLAALACIITSTPGTIWVDFDEARGLLTIHVLDLTDRDDVVNAIKGRYERRLLEIFAGTRSSYGPWPARRSCWALPCSAPSIAFSAVLGRRTV
jgi:multicomponent K+:H+ antiporter subunit E